MTLRQFLSGSGAVFIARVATAVALLGINALLARKLGAGSVGTYLFFQNFALVAAIFVNLGIGTAATKFIGGARGAGDMRGGAHIAVQSIAIAFGLILAFALLMGSAVFAGADANLSWPGLPEFTPVLLWWCVGVAIRLIAFDVLLALERPHVAAIFSGLVSAALSAAGMFGWVALGRELTLGGALWLSAATALIGGIGGTLAVLTAVWRDHRRGRHPAPELMPAIGAYFSVGLAAVFAKVLSARRKEILVVALGTVATQEAVAILGLANQLLQVIAMPMVAITSVIAPQIARAVRQGGLIANAVRIRALWVIGAAPVVLLAIVMSVFSQAISTAAYGPGYAEVAGVLVISLVGRVIPALSGPTTEVLLLSGKQWLVAAISVLELLPLVGLGVVLGAQFGAQGGAWAFTVTTLLSSIVLTACVRTRLGLWVFAWVTPTIISQLRREAPNRPESGKTLES